MPVQKSTNDEQKSCSISLQTLNIARPKDPLILIRGFFIFISFLKHSFFLLKKLRKLLVGQELLNLVVSAFHYRFGCQGCDLFFIILINFFSTELFLLYFCKAVSFFSELTLKIAQGRSILITGESSTGKTSLFRVVAKLWKPVSGLIFSTTVL